MVGSGIKSHDIEIAGEPYLFGSKGGISLGDARLEPSNPRQLGTIVIPSAHHGFGQEVSRDPNAALTISELLVEPGVLLAAGAQPHSIGTVTDGFSTEGAVYPKRPSNFFVAGGKTFFILPRSIQEYDGDSAPIGRVAAPIDFPAAGDQTAYTNWCRWRGKIIIGIESKPSSVAFGDSSQRYGYKYCEYDIGTDTFTNKVAGGDVAASFIAAGPNAIFRIVNYGLRKPPELWIGDDPNVDFGSISWIGPIYVHKGGYCTNLYAYGPHILIMKREGVMLGVDTGNVFSPLIDFDYNIEDDLFGTSIKPWLGWLLLVYKDGLLRFDPNSLTRAEVSPADVQFLIGAEDTVDQPGTVYACAVQGREVYAASSPSPGQDITIMTRGVAYEDGFFWSTYHLKDLTAGPRGCHIYKTTGGQSRFVTIGRQSTTDDAKLNAINIYGPGNSVLPAAYDSGGIYTSSRLTAEGSAHGLSVRPLQVRFWRSLPSATYTANLIIEGVATVALGTVSAGTGGVRLDVPDNANVLIGRNFQFQLVSTNAPSSGSVERVEFPISIDYEFCPNTDDAISITVLAASGQVNRMGGAHSMEDAGRIQLDNLLALSNTRQEITFPEDGRSWQVLVEEVTSEFAWPAEESSGSPGWYVKLFCRRLD